MNGYILDTSIFIALLRKKQTAIHIYASLNGSSVTTSSICVAELYEGVFRSLFAKQEAENVAEITASLDQVIPFTETEARVFGQLKVAMKRILIPDMDLQIAATCVVHQMQLVTLDTDHFPRVPGLTIYHRS